MRLLPLLAAFVAFAPSVAFAACTGPDGNEGDIVYNADCKIPMFCNGSEWVALSRDSTCMPTSACTTNGLIGHWKFDEIAGTKAPDASGNSNHGTLVNGPVWASGKVNSGLTFDGVDEFVQVTDHADFNMPDGVTIAAWINTDVVNKNQTVLGRKCDGDTTGYRLEIFYTQIRFEYGDGVTPDIRFYSPVDTITTGNWHHIAGSYDNQTVRIYHNGALVRTAASASSIAANVRDIFIGQYPCNGYNFDGVLDDVRLYDRPLSDAEVAALYNSGGGCP